ncbi:hypothetical protein PIB30_093556 [Stylosanthes scabra]|uniref:Uncharacterized protein n=1 Tax=Stylosanthes scabra TaxID=79078 RepID=A0ABU6TUP6_9FABA|nr:hypothetical protein [Stylosanthes scabra]
MGKLSASPAVGFGGGTTKGSAAGYGHDTGLLFFVSVSQGNAESCQGSAAGKGAALGHFQCLKVRLRHWADQVPQRKVTALVDVKHYKTRLGTSHRSCSNMSI